MNSFPFDYYEAYEYPDYPCEEFYCEKCQEYMYCDMNDFKRHMEMHKRSRRAS